MLLKALVILLTLCYPFFVYWGLQNDHASSVLILLAAIFVLRWFGGRSSAEKLIVIASIIGLAATVLLVDEEKGLLFYPVLVNIGLLIIFGSSLFAPQTIIEKIARIKEPSLPPEGVAYTRRVTWVWCIFFVLNGSVSAATIALGNEQLWMIYNGIVAYILIGVLVVGEWIVRYYKKKKL